MAIQPIQPIVIPAKVADKLWVSHMSVRAPSLASTVMATIRLVPYSSATNEIFNDYAQTLEVDDLFAAAAADPPPSEPAPDPGT